MTTETAPAGQATTTTAWHWAGLADGPVALALSAILVWTAEFHHFGEFGLYADDYAFVATMLGKPLDYLIATWKYDFIFFPVGRPLQFFFIALFSFIGDKIGGLSAIYLLGFAIVTLNTFLCYRLLRLRLPPASAAVGAAVFCLFPADTTKILPHAFFSLQPSLTFALLASLAYAAGRRLLTYGLAVGALLSYESGYLALFALPLFVRPWDRTTVRELVRHSLVLIAIVIADVALRLSVGESRATSAAGGLITVLTTLLSSLLVGPTHSLSGMFSGPLGAIQGWDTETHLLALGALVASAVFLVAAQRRVSAVRYREVAQVGAAGVAMLVFGYGLAFFHYPPIELAGRATSVHLGATLGMAVIAAVVSACLFAVNTRVATALIACYLAIAVGYFNTIASDYILSWQLQRMFWQQVADCCSDLQDGTILLYELDPADCGGYQWPSGEGGCRPSFISTHEWSDPLVLDQMFAFPSGWTNPPRLFGLSSWPERVRVEGDQLVWFVPPPWEHWEALPQDNVILLRRGPDGRLRRISGTIDVAGQRLRLKSAGTPEAWPPAALYRLVSGA